MDADRLIGNAPVRGYGMRTKTDDADPAICPAGVCLKKLPRPGRGRWASTQMEFRKFDAKHRSVVPMSRDCGRWEQLANKFFQLAPGLAGAIAGCRMRDGVASSASEIQH